MGDWQILSMKKSACIRILRQLDAAALRKYAANPVREPAEVDPEVYYNMIVGHQASPAYEADLIDRMKGAQGIFADNNKGYLEGAYDAQYNSSGLADTYKNASLWDKLKFAIKRWLGIKDTEALGTGVDNFQSQFAGYARQDAIRRQKAMYNTMVKRYEKETGRKWEADMANHDINVRRIQDQWLDNYSARVRQKTQQEMANRQATQADNWLANAGRRQVRATANAQYDKAFNGPTGPMPIMTAPASALPSIDAARRAVVEAQTAKQPFYSRAGRSFVNAMGGNIANYDKIDPSQQGQYFLEANNRVAELKSPQITDKLYSAGQYLHNPTMLFEQGNDYAPNYAMQHNNNMPQIGVSES